MNDGLPTDAYSHLTGEWQWNGRECKGADDKSFVPRNNIWATDKKGLFKHDTRVRVKDPASCQVLNLLFAKDNDQVYYIEGTAQAVEDVATFEVLDSGQYLAGEGYERRFGYARDSKNIYCHDFFAGKPKVLKGADLATFRRLDYGYAKDDKYVWTNGYRIKKADPESFASINCLYSKDNRHVFYDETPLQDADPGTFWIVAKTTGADASHVYFQRELLEGADPNSFQVDENNSWTGRDAVRVFHGSRLVPGADPRSFTRIGDSYYYRDNRTVYYILGEVTVIEHADPQTFEALDSAHRGADKHQIYNKGIAIQRA